MQSAIVPSMAALMPMPTRPGINSCPKTTIARKADAKMKPITTDSAAPRLCENVARYNCTRNFEACGHVQSEKMQKFVPRSALRPNQILFSHDQDP
jgi:hypothetical protein